MRSRHTSLSEQLEAQGFKLELELPEIISKGIIEPEIEHAEDISPEEESAILGKIDNLNFVPWPMSLGVLSPRLFLVLILTFIKQTWNVERHKWSDEIRKTGWLHKTLLSLNRST